MTDIEDKEFEKELVDAFEIEETPATPPAADPAKKEEPATPPAATPKVEEPKKDDPANPADPNKEDEELELPSADPAKPAEEDPANPKAPEAPEEPAAPTPLTEEGIRKLLQEDRVQQRNSAVEMQSATQTVMEAYYPDGLSNVLTTPDGKELKTPQDVVDASNGEMTTEQAAQWLMNQQYELDQNIDKIKRQAETIAETTLTFKRDATIALQKYEPLFKAYPHLQPKVYATMMKQVKIDEDKGVILDAPDVLDLYDTYLEPYQQAYELANQTPATNPTPAPAATPPAAPPAKPGQADRLDESGDGAPTTEVDDPNDFAQQVAKELAKGA